MKLTYRQRNLLKQLLNSDKLQTIENYANKSYVSVRTIHKDLDEIEHFLKGSPVFLIRKSGVGIGIEGNLEERQNTLKKIFVDQESKNSLSTKYRRLRISSYLLNHKEGSSVQRLADEYFVSKSSIAIDLEKIEEWCNEYNLELIKDRSGTRIKGKEKHVRHAMSNLIYEFKKIEVTQEENYDDESRIDLYTQYRLLNLFPNISLKIIEEIIVDNERRLNYRINDISFTILITHLVIMVQRIQNGDSLELDSFLDENNASNVVFKTANSIALELSKAFNITINHVEIHFIYIYLISLGIQSNFRNIEFDDHVLTIEPKIKEITRKVIEHVSNITQINLSFDKPLYFGLLTHIKPMIERIKYGITLKNPLIDEIKTNFASILSVLYLLVPEFNKLFDAHLTDNELSYMAIHFQAALERNAPCQKIVIVCPEGVGFSRFLANRISKFVPSVEIIDIVPAHKARKIDSANIDFIISTVPLQSNIPVILVSSIVDFSDIQTISNYIIEKNISSINVEFNNLKKMIDSSLIFLLEEDENQTEIIQQVCTKLHQQNFVSIDFEKSVYEREKISPTCLGNSIAIPHGNQDFVKQSKIAIIIPKNHIDWSDGKVNLIFLLAINISHGSYVKDGLTDFYNLMDSPKLLEKLRNAVSIFDVMNIFH